MVNSPTSVESLAAFCNKSALRVGRRDTSHIRATLCGVIL
ncbi:Uncharacterised protein [Mycobacteroides abscessus subsp. abscessus]|nr:Uncharacterised protein [Mycobacteroides abscessus subsp. abscessus]